MSLNPYWITLLEDFYGRITLQQVFYFAGLAVYITLGVSEINGEKRK